MLWKDLKELFGQPNKSLSIIPGTPEVYSILAKTSIQIVTILVEIHVLQYQDKLGVRGSYLVGIMVLDRLVPNRKRSTSRLSIVILLI